MCRQPLRAAVGWIQPAWTPTTPITVWKRTVTDAPTSFTATITPSVDHSSNRMAGIITFHLYSSSENGYCLNMTRVHTPVEEWEWNDTHGNAGDLKFTPDQADLELDYMGQYEEEATARTTSAKLEITAEVTCLDWGAWGAMEVTAEWPTGPVTGLPTARVIVGESADPDRLAVYLPTDVLPEGGNHIADVGAGAAFNGLIASADTEEDPAAKRDAGGNIIPGDGWSAYDEYRGLVIDGEHARLAPDGGRDVLIFNPDGFSLDHAALGYQLWPGLRGNEVDVASAAARVRRYPTNQSDAGDCDYAWHVYEGTIGGGVFGSTNGAVISGGSSVMDRDAIAAAYNEPPPNPTLIATAEARIVGHEFGHAMAIRKAGSAHVDQNSPPVDHVCIMVRRYLPTPPDPSFCSSSYSGDLPCVANHHVLEPWGGP